jgi:two-component system, cell cycle sensor histidine kinase and response regulator CckA
VKTIVDLAADGQHAEPLAVLLISAHAADETRLREAFGHWRAAYAPLPLLQVAAAVDDAATRLDAGGIGVCMFSMGADVDLPALRRLLQHAGDTPIVVCTDAADQHVGVDLLRAGAADHIVRGEATPELVLRTLLHAAERARVEAQAFRQALELARLRDADARARSAEERVLRHLEAMPQAFLALDREWRFVYLNRATERNISRSRTELLGRVVWEVYPELVGSELERQYRRAVDEQVTVQFLFEFPALDMVTEILAHPSEDGLAVYVTDITERMRAMHAAAVSANRYRALFENSLDGIFEALPDGTITALNQAACRLLGGSQSELVGKGRGAIMDLTDPRLSPALAQRERTGRFHGELTMVRADGSTFPAEVSSALFFGQDGAPRTTTTVRDMTDRRRAEEALRRSEARFRGVFEQAALGLVLVDNNAHILEINRRLLDLLGYTLPELHELGWAAITHPDDLPRELELIERLRTGMLDTCVVEKRYIRGNRSVLWALLNVSRLRGAGGEDYYLCAVEDISAMKNAEQALRESEERFRQLAENVRDVFWIAGETPGRATYISPAFRDIWQRDPQGLVRGEYDMLDTIHPDDRTRVLPALSGDLGGEWTVEYRILRPDGDVRWIRDRSFEIPGETRSSRPRMAGVAQDITDMKRAEEELRRSEAHFRALIDNATEIISIVEADGRFRYLNPAVRNVLGYLPEQLLGESLLQMIHPDDLGAAVRAMATIAAGDGETADFHLRIRHVDGGWRHIEGTGRNLLRHPAIRGIVTHARDVTERKLAEDALRASEEALRQAQKMEAVGRLAGGIAHDFNNVLTAISGHAALLLEELSEGHPLRADADEIRAGADRAAGLTRQLLAFSRRQVLQPRLLDIRDVLGSMERLLRRLLGEDLNLQIRLPRQLGQVRADSSQIEQVVLNLAVNARDAMPDGGRLRIAVEDVHIGSDEVHNHHNVPSGDWVVLRVHDSGAGIPPEIQEKIFEPFFTTKELGKGTGLGLSTVYGILRQTGGYIGVDSREGDGTEFVVYLPRAREEEQEQREEESVPVNGLCGDETVLLVEDEPAVRALASRVLRRAGYTVLVAGNGAEGLEIAGRLGHQIDLVVSDVVMPVMSGPDMANRLRQAFPALRTLFISGYSAESAVRQGGLRGEDLFLEKPFTPDALARKVREALDIGVQA